MARTKALTIRLTPAARADLIGIWHWNASKNGEARADAYVDFLLASLDRLAMNPSLGKAVPEYEGLRRYLVKKRSRSHGHIVFYRHDADKLEVIHFYHTAQDWLGRMSKEKE